MSKPDDYIYEPLIITLDYANNTLHFTGDINSDTEKMIKSFIKVLRRDMNDSIKLSSDLGGIPIKYGPQDWKEEMDDEPIIL